MLLAFLIVNLSSLLFLSPRAPITTGIESVQALYQVNLNLFYLCTWSLCLWVLWKCFFQRGIATDVNEHAPFFFVVLDNNVRSVSVQSGIPEYGVVVVFSHFNFFGFMFITLLSCLDFETYANCPVSVCCRLVVPRDMYSGLASSRQLVTMC